MDGVTITEIYHSCWIFFYVTQFLLPRLETSGGQGLGIILSFSAIDSSTVPRLCCSACDTHLGGHVSGGSLTLKPTPRWALRGGFKEQNQVPFVRIFSLLKMI